VRLIDELFIRHPSGAFHSWDELAVELGEILESIEESSIQKITFILAHLKRLVIS